VIALYSLALLVSAALPFLHAVCVSPAKST